MNTRETRTKTDRKPTRKQQYLKRKRKHQQKQILVFGSLVLLLIVLIALLVHSCSAGEEPKETKPSTPVATTLEEPEESAKTATVLAVGDNLMHQGVVDSVRQSDGSYDFTEIFARLKDEFSAADIACFLQETILVEDEEDTSNGLPYYGTTSDLAAAVQEAGFDVVAHATEHAYDKGLDPIVFTKSTWDKLGVKALGIHTSEEDAKNVTVLEANGIRVAFLNYTYFDDEMPKATESYAVDYLDDQQAIAAQIAAAKEKSDIVIVIAHWGEMTTYEANESQTTWAQFFADNGVGAVIGSHPHVLQPVELLTGKDGNVMPVYYSLGNYMTHMSGYYNMLGGMAELTITKDASGTRVTAYNLTPLVEVIDTSGSGFQFYTVKLSDYTDEMAKNHQLDGTGTENITELYQSVFPNAPVTGTGAVIGDSPTTSGGTNPTDPSDSSDSESPSETDADSSTDPSEES